LKNGDGKTIRFAPEPRKSGPGAAPAPAKSFAGKDSIAAVSFSGRSVPGALGLKQKREIGAQLKISSSSYLEIEILQ
jgi:hypothetical protein